MDHQVGALAVLGKIGVPKGFLLCDLGEAHDAPIAYEVLQDQFLDMNVKVRLNTGSTFRDSYRRRHHLIS